MLKSLWETYCAVILWVIIPMKLVGIMQDVQTLGDYIFNDGA